MLSAAKQSRSGQDAKPCSQRFVQPQASHYVTRKACAFHGKLLSVNQSAKDFELCGAVWWCGALWSPYRTHQSDLLIDAHSANLNVLSCDGEAHALQEVAMSVCRRMLGESQRTQRTDDSWQSTCTIMSKDQMIQVKFAGRLGSSCYSAYIKLNSFILQRLLPQTLIYLRMRRSYTQNQWVGGTIRRRQNFSIATAHLQAVHRGGRFIIRRDLTLN